MKQNQQRDAAAQTLINDAEQKAQEYRCEADRIRNVLKRFGMTSEALSRSGVQSLQTLSAACIALDAKDTTKSTLMIAAGQRQRDLLDLEETMIHEKRDREKLAKQTKEAVARKIALEKVLSEFDSEEQLKLASLKNEKQQADFFDKKHSEYQKQLKKLDVELRNNFTRYQPVSHEELRKQAQRLADLTEELMPLRAKLDSYQNLPADLTLTRVKVEEAKLRLKRIVQELDEKITLLCL